MDGFELQFSLKTTVAALARTLAIMMFSAPGTLGIFGAVAVPAGIVVAWFLGRGDRRTLISIFDSERLRTVDDTPDEKRRSVREESRTGSERALTPRQCRSLNVWYRQARLHHPKLESYDSLVRDGEVVDLFRRLNCDSNFSAAQRKKIIDDLLHQLCDHDARRS